MKKPSAKTADQDIPELKREPLGSAVRGKFYEAAKGTVVVLLDPALARAFPTSESVNAALLGLLELAARVTVRPKRAPRKRVVA